MNEIHREFFKGERRQLRRLFFYLFTFGCLLPDIAFGIRAENSLYIF